VGDYSTGYLIFRLFLFFTVEDQNFHAKAPKELLEGFEAEPGKAVRVGDRNGANPFCFGQLDQFEETFAVAFDTARHILDFIDFFVLSSYRLSQKVKLGFQVLFLVVRRDAGIDGDGVGPFLSEKPQESAFRVQSVSAFRKGVRPIRKLLTPQCLTESSVLLYMLKVT